LALALVGLDRPDLADVGRHLSHGLFVGALDNNELPLVALNRQHHARQRLKEYLVRVPHAQLQSLPVQVRPIAHALNLQPSGETLAHARDHVGHQGSR